jgi:hypothetical protein
MQKNNTQTMKARGFNFLKIWEKIHAIQSYLQSDRAVKESTRILPLRRGDLLFFGREETPLERNIHWTYVQYKCF